MTEHRIKFKASRNIFNPWYELPEVHVGVGSINVATPDPMPVTCPAKIVQHPGWLRVVNDDMVILALKLLGIESIVSLPDGFHLIGQWNIHPL